MTGGPRPAGSYRPRPAPALAREAHKGDAGRVLCLVGSRLMPGAAILSLRAAARAGAGLVTLACKDRELLSVVPPAVPEAIYVEGLALAERDDDARLAGPGLGDDERTRELCEVLLDDAFDGPLALDADGLNVFAGDLERLAPRAGPLVLTPHPGEAGRLLGRPVPHGDDGRAACALEIANRANAVCCLKGHRTVVTDGERVVLNTTGNPGMATAGAGDVLSGILVAYLAAAHVADDERFGVFDAAASAVHVHGHAGDLAAAVRGERAVVASDLIEFLPQAQQDFERAALDG